MLWVIIVITVTGRDVRERLCSFGQWTRTDLLIFLKEEYIMKNWFLGLPRANQIMLVLVVLGFLLQFIIPPVASALYGLIVMGGIAVWLLMDKARFQSDKIFFGIAVFFALKNLYDLVKYLG